MTSPNPVFLPYPTTQVEDLPNLVECGFTTPGWYFWDETWAHCHGPYPTEEDAVHALGDYSLALERRRRE